MNDEERNSKEAGIVDCVLDYFEGWFEGDAGRMERALHPELAKRALASSDGLLDETTAPWMIEATGRGVGREASPVDLAIEVKVEDIHREVASVTVHSAVYREYVHLVRTADGWKIVNALWTWT